MSIEVIGHGGAGGFSPGNSRASIQKALDLRVDRIEVDVLATADGDLVLVHDSKLRIDGGRPTPVQRLSTKTFRSHLDSMLTLDEFFELIGPAMPVLLDLKRPGYELAVRDAVNSQPERDIWISTTHGLSIHALKGELPGVRFGLSSGHLASAIATPGLRALSVEIVRTLMPVPLIAAAKICGAAMVMANHRACSGFLVRGACAAGLDIAVWTVNRPAEIARMADLGVNAIISNRPDLVRETLDR